MRLLVAEDDKAISMGLGYSLKSEGYEVCVVSSVADALLKLSTISFDLAILDISLPDGNGYEICEKIKSYGNIPVIFLTALDDEVNVVMGLDMGADDYIIKPFRIRELMSRIKTVLRRYGKSSNSVIKLGNININTSKAAISKNGEEVFLTALEYKLLLTLINSDGVILTRSQLLEGIWDIAGDFVNDNTLTVYIKRLRDKLEEDPADPQIIKTVRGLGYRIGKIDEN